MQNIFSSGRPRGRRFFFSILVGSLAVGALSARPARAEDLSAYETVNLKPQYAETDKNFAFYWSIWRGLTGRERDSIRASGRGDLISLKQITITTYECGSAKTLRQDDEKFYYRDPIELSPDAGLTPMAFAPRWGYRYLVMLHLPSAWLLRGPNAASPKSTFGEILIDATHRLFSGNQIKEDEFWDFESYWKPDWKYKDQVAKYAPSVWPVFYDERAHKGHTLFEPALWNRKDSLVSESHVKAKLVWNWCRTGERPRTAFLYPPGGLPAPGPNRPGREDAGSAQIRLIESPNWMDRKEARID